MNLYKITQTDRQGMDTYTEAVVAAETAKKARETHPSEGDGTGSLGWDSSTWAKSPERVTAELLGKAKKSLKAGVIVASFYGV